MAKAPAYDDVVEALVAQWALMVGAAPALDLAAPTRLPGWDTAMLLGHVTASTAHVTALAAAPPPLAAALEAVGYYDVPTGDAPVPDSATATDLATAVEAASATLRGTPGDRAVRTWAGGMRLADVVRLQVLEAVVHGLDLGVPPDRTALRLAVRLLTAVLVHRHPGRSVEVRIPPFDAVQVLAGPRHTRGTPPGVVEADPVAFVEVCTGRLAWLDALGDGRVRASGERTDLSPYLPLMR